MNRDKWTPEFLDEMARVADEPADRVVRELFESQKIWRFLAAMKDLRNRSSAQLAPAPADSFLDTQSVLPAWASEAKILKAQDLFSEYGPLTIMALFCASLPECYVMSNEAATLNRTGQLEDKTLFRVRQTGRLVFSVMVSGGLDKKSEKQPDDWLSGRTQTLVVRLIHATIRYLIENSPEVPEFKTASVRTAHASDDSAEGEEERVAHALTYRVWLEAFRGQAGDSHPDKPDVEESARGVVNNARPINQVELAYTLLTFSYVIIRSLRILGIRWTPEEEQAYMHAWNVVGSILGVHDSLMAQSYEEGEYLFQQIKNRHRAKTRAGHDLSVALLDAMASTFRWKIIQPLPRALTRYLIGRETAAELGLDAKGHGLLQAIGFHLLLVAVRVIASAGRALGKNNPIANWVMRHIAQGLMLHLLATETRSFFAPMELKNLASAKMQPFEGAIFNKVEILPHGERRVSREPDRRRKQVTISFPDRRSEQRRKLTPAGVS